MLPAQIYVGIIERYHSHFCTQYQLLSIQSCAKVTFKKLTFKFCLLFQHQSFGLNIKSRYYSRSPNNAACFWAEQEKVKWNSRQICLPPPPNSQMTRYFLPKKWSPQIVKRGWAYGCARCHATSWHVPPSDGAWNHYLTVAFIVDILGLSCDGLGRILICPDANI